MDRSEIVGYLRQNLEGTSDERPLYRRLRDGLELAISEGHLAKGAFVPSERVLANELGLSRVTIRKAIDELSEKGLLIRRHGSKTEVASRVEKALSGLSGFSEEHPLQGNGTRRPLAFPENNDAVSNRSHGAGHLTV